METQKTYKKDTDRLECWTDGASIQIVAATSFGDPVDCSSEEAKEFAFKILEMVKKMDA